MRRTLISLAALAIATPAAAQSDVAYTWCTSQYNNARLLVMLSPSSGLAAVGGPNDSFETTAKGRYVYYQGQGTLITDQGGGTLAIKDDGSAMLSDKGMTVRFMCGKFQRFAPQQRRNVFAF